MEDSAGMGEVQGGVVEQLQRGRAAAAQASSKRPSRASSADGDGGRFVRRRARTIAHMSGKRRGGGGLRVIYLNLDRHCKGSRRGLDTNKWEGVWAGTRGKAGATTADVIVFGEVCLGKRAQVPYAPQGMSMFVVSASNAQGGVLVAVRSSLRPRQVWQLNNAGIELAAVSCVFEGQSYLVAGFYAHGEVGVDDTKRLVTDEIESFLRDVRAGLHDSGKRVAGEERKLGMHHNALHNAIFIFVGDTNARFGPSPRAVRAFDDNDPDHELPWLSVDKCVGCGSTQLARGKLWWDMLRRVEMRVVNDLEVPVGGGARCAMHTNNWEGRTADMAADARRVVRSVIDIAAIGGPRGFDRAHLAHIGVGAGARIHLTAAWLETAAVRRHELICLVMSVPSTAVPRVKPPLADKKFTFRAAEVDRGQYAQWGRAADVRTSAMLRENGGQVLEMAQLAEMLGSVAELHLKPTLTPIADDHSTRPFWRELRAANAAHDKVSMRIGQGASESDVAAAAALTAECGAKLKAAIHEREVSRAFFTRSVLDRGWSRNSRRFFADLAYIIGTPSKFGHRTERLQHAASPGGFATLPNQQCVAFAQQFGNVGKKPLPEGGPEGFTLPPHAYYESECARILAAVYDMGGTDQQENRDITLDELARLAKRISLGKGADAENFRGDYWHKVCNKILDGSAGGHYSVTMHALLNSLNALWRGEHRLVANEEWYKQRVVPIFKGGDLPPDDPSSYRDVTVTSRQEALIATIACARLREKLELSGIPSQMLDSAQHGFRARKSCDTALFTMQSIMQRHFLSKAPLLMCFWDVRKAFPTTWRERLTVRLWQRGIRGRLLYYILNSGAMRYSRYVDVPGSTERAYFSDERGLSTGHVLSPLLFLIEQDDMGAYLADDPHPGVGVDMGMGMGAGDRMAANFFADDGVGIASCAATGPDAVRTALTGMHRLLQRIEVYCDDARRELNVKNKATVIMAMNIHDDVLQSAGFMLCGHKVEIVDEFKYLGTMITGNMRRPTAQLASLSGRVWQDFQQKRVDKMLPRVNAGLYSPELSARMRRQLITNWVSAAEYGAGVMVCAPWESLNVEYNAMLVRGLHLPSKTGGVPAEMLWGEWGLWPLEARFKMHTLRVWSCVMEMPLTSWARRAWEMLVDEAARHPLKDIAHTLVARVRQTLADVGHAEDFGTGMRGVELDGDEPEETHKRLLHVWASAYWRRGMTEVAHDGRDARVTLYDHYAHLVPDTLGFCEYLEQRDRRAQVVDTRLRTGKNCLRVRTAAAAPSHHRLARDERVCQHCGSGEPETEFHYYMQCAKWAKYRDWMVTSIMTCNSLSPQFKAALGPFASDNDAWYRLLMCAPYGAAFHVDYNMPSSKLALRISSEEWGAVSEEQVVHARRVLRDRRVIQTLMSSIKVAWYLARSRLSGFDHE